MLVVEGLSFQEVKNKELLLLEPSAKDHIF